MNYIAIPGIKCRMKIEPDSVIRVTCAVYGVRTIDVIKKTRIRTLVEVRQMCFYFLATYTRMSLKSIGKIFPLITFDHTTVIHGRERIRSLLTIEEDLRQKLFDIKKEFITR